MAETETVTVQPEPVESGAVLDFSGNMVLLTWVAFALAAVVLGKLVWKPILSFIEARESEIKASLDDAAKARKAAQEADAKAAETIATAEREARRKADELAQAAQRHIAALEDDAREALAAKRKLAEARLEEERADALKRLEEQTGGEIAHALERILPGLLTDTQRQAYQDRIAAEIKLDA